MKARIENGQIRRYINLPKYYKHWAGNFDGQPTTIHEQEGFYDVIEPIVDYGLQTRGAIYWDETTSTFTYSVIDKTQEQLDIEEEQRLDNLDNQIDNTVIRKLITKSMDTILEDEASIKQEDIDDAITLYKQWRKNTIYSINNKVVYNEALYKVVQAHTSQSDWTPDVTPALFTIFTPAGVIAEWVQPIGAQDAYAIDAQVTHNGSTWINITANNVWEPGVYGWTEIV